MRVLGIGDYNDLGSLYLRLAAERYVMVVTGRGATIEEAQRDAYSLAAKVALPNVRYRNDIGHALRASGLAELTRLGWL